MSFTCIKTGFYANLPNGNFLYGDAFAMAFLNSEVARYSDEPHAGDDHLLLRICSESVEKRIPVNIELRTYDHWFDERSGTKVNQPGEPFCRLWQPLNSTMICSPGQWSWLGYEGKDSSQ